MKTEYSAPENLEEEIIRISLEWYARGIAIFPQENLALEFEWDLTGVTAGQALSWKVWTNRYGQAVRKEWVGKLRFNLAIAEENWEHYSQQIIPHEVAHLIANKFFDDNCGHDVRWQSVMIKFGLSPDRCHDYSVEHLRREVHRKKFTWECCKCHQEVVVGKKVHEHLMNHPGVRYHKFCGSNHFVFLHESTGGKPQATEADY